jgi:hypothetical protein
MFESRSSRANMKSEEASRKLEIELKETKELLAKKEKEYEKTCETYRAELTSIKDEKNNLQVSFFFEILVTETFPSRRERTGFRKTSRI